MDTEFEAMPDIVNLYCNQNYTLDDIPQGLKTIIDKMCEYAKNSHYSNIQTETVGDYSVTTNEKDLFQTFSGMLSVYKRLKTL